MRQGQNSKRSRGRSGGRRNTSPRHQSFDSNGPSIRIRGNAHQVYEKYIQLAHDANTAGDRVAAENMYQHAEHYFRIMNVDDGDSQQRGQNRSNESDQRPHQRNPQQGQDDPQPGAEPEAHAEQPTQGESGAGMNGSGENRGNGAAESDQAEGKSTQKEDEPRPERQLRRTRRGPGRPRNDAPDTEAVAEAPKEIATDPEPVAEAAEAEGKEVQ